MANCACNLLKGIWSFFLGSLRIILFVGCLIFTIIQILWIVVIFHDETNSDLKLPGSENLSSCDYLHALGLLLLALFGCYGSFYRHLPSLKAFSLMTAASTAILILMIMYKSPDEFNNGIDKFADRMKRLMYSYDWNEGADTEANRAWDTLQEMLCCGLTGPDDWRNKRPKNYPEGTYPSSCCLNSLFRTANQSRTHYCGKTDDLFKTGCLERVKQIEAFSFVVAIMYIIFQLTLCVLACIVGNFNLERCPPASSNPSETNRRFLPQQYERLTGSFYVRQPAVNETYQPEMNKMNIPPIYPGAFEVEKLGYSAPPPTYGSAT